MYRRPRLGAKKSGPNAVIMEGVTTYKDDHMTPNILMAQLRRIGGIKEEDMHYKIHNLSVPEKRKSFFLLLILLDITDRVCARQDAVEHDHYPRVEDHHCRAVHS